MSGGYATDIDAIVTIHANTIRIAAGQRSASIGARPPWHNTSVS